MSKYYTKEEKLQMLKSVENLEFVNKNITQAWGKAGKPNFWILHSDQGFHYPNKTYKLLCEKLEI